MNRPPKREFNPRIQVEIFKENLPIENTAMHTAVTLTNDDTKARSRNIFAINLDSVSWHSLVLGISIKNGSVTFPDRYDVSHLDHKPISVRFSILETKKHKISHTILFSQ